MSLQGHLNRLLGTKGLGAQRAANELAGTEGKELLGALNELNSSKGLGLHRVCREIADDNGGDPTKDSLGALGSISSVASFGAVIYLLNHSSSFTDGVAFYVGG